jgi:2-aminoethylphosphonate-pyruvate transaminase
MTSEAVRQAGAQPDINHRDPEFIELMASVKLRLQTLYPSDHHAYLIGGSGTAAAEAMLTSCIEKGPVLVLENGYYSARTHVKLEIHGIPHKVLRYGWLEPWNLDQIQEELRTDNYEAVMGLHHETTTGRLNPVGEVARLCERYGANLMIDAMSSFGADPLDLSGVSAVASSANKCLHGLPGVSLVLVRNDLAAKIDKFPRRTFYLSLPMYAGLTPPLTPPVPALSSFSQALNELESVEMRQAEYRQRAGTIRSAIGELGLAMPIPETEMSCTLTMCSLPAGWTSDRWLEANREAGFMLYGCKGDLREKYFQVANMGEIPDGAIEEWLREARRLLGH